jgi:hypothetical protein
MSTPDAATTEAIALLHETPLIGVWSFSEDNRTWNADMSYI